MFEIKTLKKLINLIRLIPNKSKINLVILSFVVITASVIEVLSVYLIVPFYKVIVEGKSLEEIFPFILRILNITISSVKQEQLITITSFAIFLCSCKYFRTLALWRTDITSAKIGAYLFSSAYSKILSDHTNHYYSRT